MKASTADSLVVFLTPLKRAGWDAFSQPFVPIPRIMKERKSEDKYVPSVSRRLSG